MTPTTIKLVAKANFPAISCEKLWDIGTARATITIKNQEKKKTYLIYAQF